MPDTLVTLAAAGPDVDTTPVADDAGSDEPPSHRAAAPMPRGAR